MPRFVAIYQVDFLSESDIHAIMVSEDLRNHILEFIDDDDGDTVALLELSPESAAITPVVDVRILRSARNVLLRTKNKEAYDIARSLDQYAFALEKREMDEEVAVVTNYDWSTFIEVASQVINGHNPLDI